MRSAYADHVKLVVVLDKVDAYQKHYFNVLLIDDDWKRSPLMGSVGEANG